MSAAHYHIEIEYIPDTREDPDSFRLHRTSVFRVNPTAEVIAAVRAFETVLAQAELPPPDEAWDAWLEDNKDKVPEGQVEFIRTAYHDGYVDGKHAAEHTEMMKELDEIRNLVLSAKAK